jgi:hypothetical protein
MLIQILELINVRYTCTSTLSNNFVAIHHYSFDEQVGIATDKSLSPFPTDIPQQANYLPYTERTGVNIDFFQLVKTNQSMFKYLINQSITLLSDHESGRHGHPSEPANPVRHSHLGGLHMAAQPAKPPKAARHGWRGPARPA